MEPHVAIISLGVRDFDRAKRFYADGLGWPMQQEQDDWVCFSLGEGASALTLFPWHELAADSGVAADGSGFRGVTLAYNVRSRERTFATLYFIPAKGSVATHCGDSRMSMPAGFPRSRSDSIMRGKSAPALRIRAEQGEIHTAAPAKLFQCSAVI